MSVRREAAGAAAVGSAGAGNAGVLVVKVSLVRELQDAVNGTRWAHCAVSGDSEFLVGAAGGKADASFVAGCAIV